MKRLAIAAFVVVVALAGAFWYWSTAPYRAIEGRINPLRTEADVVRIFGQPRHIFNKGTTGYHVRGYAFKERPITGKVLVYFPAESATDGYDVILYVYVDEQGNVEDHFVGGS